MKWLIYVLAAGLSTNVLAADFDKTVTVGDEMLTMCAQTPIKKMLFNLGDVALYAKDCQQTSSDSITRQPVHLTFKYERAFDGEDFIKSSEELIKRNTTQQEYQQIRSDMQAFNQNYQGIEDGGIYEISWSETTGLLLTKNAQQISQHDSAQLAEIYFRIWFGADPFSKKMRDALLNGD